MSAALSPRLVSNVIVTDMYQIVPHRKLFWELEVPKKTNLELTLMVMVLLVDGILAPFAGP
jgi:hypothetical protein